MQRYFSKKLESNILFINNEDFNHIKKVMRFKPSDKVKIVYDKKVFLCELNQDLETATIIEEISNTVENYNLRLFMPILQEEKMDMILQKGTELGIREFIPVNMERCKFKINEDKREKKIVRWHMICKEASEQSERNNIPEVSNIINLKNIDADADYLLLCSLDKKNSKTIRETFKSINKNDIINVVFGPEGGLSKNEEDYLVSKGYKLLNFGEQVLRTETAPLY
ncbi:16S rRNA (uracil(1498)-N(3))-methyltransferase, partial [bacterium]|nr:16S rRNA (uracil(1498)-N(3))-methyltransferase [bacterium]